MRALLLLLAVGCAKDRTLVPAPSAKIAPGVGEGALDEAGQVVVEVRAGTWSGVPETLQGIEPLLVTVDNGSQHPLRVRYQGIQLRADDGEVYAALPPYDIRGGEDVPVPMAEAGSDFLVAPPASRYYPGLARWNGPWDVNPDYWDTWYDQFTRIELPTQDMIRKALPEGVLQPGGRVTGYVYFKKVGREVQDVQFEMELVDAQTHEQFGTVRVPFRVVREGEAVTQATAPDEPSS